MSFMLLPNGAEYHFTGAASLTPEGRPIDIGNIAHQLALINRFHGATTRPYSVAEHSLLVAEIARRAGATPVVQLAALLHDAHECFTQDLASPAKQAVDCQGVISGWPIAAWWEFEEDHALTLRRNFGLLTTFITHRKALREWDLIALATERRDLTAWRADTHAPWPVLEGIEPVEWAHLDRGDCLQTTWLGWKAYFLGYFDDVKKWLNFDQACLADGATNAAQGPQP